MNLLDTINEYWGILGAIVAFSVTFVRMEVAIKNINERELKKDLQFNKMKKEMDSTHTIMQEDISGVKKEMVSENKLFSLEFKKIEIAMAKMGSTMDYIKQEVTKK